MPNEKLLKRADRLAFFKVGEAYKRMTGFTNLAQSKNAKEYSRHYVDQISESTDVVGYAPAISYSFDRHENNDIHDAIALIHDQEKIGADAVVEIVVVDTNKSSDNAYSRKYSVIPNGNDDGTDALIYTGSFKAVSDVEVKTATSNDDYQTVTLS